MLFPAVRCSKKCEAPAGIITKKTAKRRQCTEPVIFYFDLKFLLMFHTTNNLYCFGTKLVKVLRQSKCISILLYKKIMHCDFGLDIAPIFIPFHTIRCYHCDMYGFRVFVSAMNAAFLLRRFSSVFLSITNSVLTYFISHRLIIPSLRSMSKSTCVPSS